MMPSLKARPDAEPRYFKTFEIGLVADFDLGMGSEPVQWLDNRRKP